MKNGNVPASSAANFPLDYVPEFIGIKFGATGAMDKLIVTILGKDAAINITGAMYKLFAQSYNYAALDATVDVMLLPLGLGLINGARCTIDITTGAGAGGVDLYTFSSKAQKDVRPGNRVVISSLLDTVKANSGYQLRRFLKAAVLSPGASDTYNMMGSEIAGRTSQQMTQEEFVAMANMKYDNSNNDLVIDNTDQLISTITLNPSAERTIGIQKLIKV